jgi:hypothetical protein
LSIQLGTSWRAKTIEELSAEDQLGQLLGESDREELIRFLDQVDRLKFAPERSNNRDESLRQELDNWEPRVAALRSKIQAKPARQEKNGLQGTQRPART